MAVKFSANPEMQPIHVTTELIEEILGIPTYQAEAEHKITEPGVAIGMAWTPFGGSTMLVETSKSPGKGRLRVTG